MGIGFKSVFGRFREARISGWGWSFRYETRAVTGQRYGDVQTEPLGAVLPIWDDRIPEPDKGFTTRFELSNRLNQDADLRSDLARLLPDDDLTLLAILAESTLKRLDVDGCVWDLDIDTMGDGGQRTASARSGDDVWRWQLFPVEFQPSPAAIGRFLAHRHIRPDDLPEDERDQVYAAAARPRRVLGVLPLDDLGAPDPPAQGQLYATLPTEIALPFGLHVNADWLLNISRTGLREIEDNPWQRDIADRIADVLASFLVWVARTFSDPDTVGQALTALASPSRESGELEAILAEERWLSRLHDLLDNAGVVPVWSDDAGEVSFAAPCEVIVPPAPLAAAFEQQPALRPATLLNGSVLVRKVLGTGGRELMASAGLLTEMSEDQLEKTWADGLERWWEQIDGDESTGRDLLFRLWAVVSRLAEEKKWSTESLRCVRTADGTWRSAHESAFFDEPPPSDREPGGGETRQFVLAPVSREIFIAETWVSALRRGAGKERERGQFGSLSTARRWVEAGAIRVGLRELVEGAVKALEAAPAPDWSVLVPLGRWALHRNRPDLLVRVLVESENDQQGVVVDRALLSEPYVRDQNREALFPDTPAVSGAYQDETTTADLHEWRGFFQKAGVRGALRVRAVAGHAERWQRKRVAKFLGRDLGPYEDSNNSGYTLRDFDISPELPDPEAPSESRAAVAAWVDDGFSALRGKGRRQVQYFYRYQWPPITGTRRSAWARKLSELAWVPCGGRELMRPQDVLPRGDPARAGAPVADLSDALLSVLEHEGVTFGGEIPAATALQRLLTIGSQLAAEQLASLLQEIRDQGLTEDDAHRLRQAVQKLQIPTDDGRRVPLGRVVHSVGGGQLRGALGGWIVPLARIHEQLVGELEHADFPYEIPPTTTGEQALDCIRDIWRRARSSPARLANEVRDVLPNAYAYCLEDCTGDPSLLSKWEAAVREAAVFVEREWVVLANAKNVYFDDVDDRRFLPDNADVRTVTAGHLGNSRAEQTRAAKALGLPLLSEAVTMEWSKEHAEPVDAEWARRFDLVCQLLRAVRGGEKADGEVGTNADLELRQIRNLVLRVSFAGGTPQDVPVNARLRDAVLEVAGRPVQFGADAAKELLRDLAFRQRGGLAADLTGMLMTIDVDEDFRLAADKFRRSYASDFVQIPPAQPDPPGEADEKVAEPAEDDRPRASSAVEPTAQSQDAEQSTTQDAPSASSEHHKVDPAEVPAPDARSRAQATVDSRGSKSSSSSYTRNSALARQNAVAKTLKALRSALKGEVATAGDEAEPDEREQGGRGEGPLSDEVYRQIAARYERACGRDPKMGRSNQEGWDLLSVDPKTGAERLIEVKGKGCAWVEDEVVELTRAQVHKAFKALDGRTSGGSGTWYLYVVERTEEGDFQVLPIENPVHVAGKWILSGQSWREVAVMPRRIGADGNGQQQ